ncbi:MAG: YidC/Oxa1 family membrane protein insertase [Candidatus Paceibacterota bacterium]|jgi:YidC/Oxa1 family membrane protein insertase|nr:YidC/Oxa1 family membrane protein insertase [Candidatus Paceibacterota bacterium]MDD4998860.1 YidC/Oxa1 family membrane protein insertase [Candidatus Paceibacterota bacterium]MDD5545094.1 YidC/Oxa1 family membrane protein insertase [Candidatus Paceibacterota bacterium]
MTFSQLIFFQPLFNFLAFLIRIFGGSLGWAVIVLSVLIRFAFWPWNKKTMIDQRKMVKIQPKINALQKEFSKDPLKANKEVMRVFKEEKINPYNSFIFIFAQLIIFIALFSFFSQIVTSDWSVHLYSFMPFPDKVNYLFLGFFDLRQPSLFLAVFSAILNAILTFLQPSQGQNKIMFLGLPFIILLFYKNFPSVVILYWVGFSLISIVQEYSLKKYFLKLQTEKQISQQKSQT